MVRMETHSAPLSLHEAATELGVTPEEMFDLVFSGAIPSVRDSGGLPAISPEALEEYRRSGADS